MVGNRPEASKELKNKRKVAGNNNVAAGAWGNNLTDLGVVHLSNRVRKGASGIDDALI